MNTSMILTGLFLGAISSTDRDLLMEFGELTALSTDSFENARAEISYQVSQLSKQERKEWVGIILDMDVTPKISMNTGEARIAL